MGPAARLLRQNGYRADSHAIRALVKAIPEAAALAAQGPDKRPPRATGRPRELDGRELARARKLVERGSTLDEVAELLRRPRTTIWSALRRK